MTLSTLTAYTTIPEDSDATPGLWDRRFQTVHADLDQLNTDAGSASGLATINSALTVVNSGLTALNSALTVALTGGAANFLGSWFTGVASVALSDRSIAYVTSTSSLSMADSTNSLKAPVGNLWICLGGSTASSVATFGLPGAWVGGLAASIATGATVYLNTTGGLTATPPSAQSTVVHCCGVMLSNRTVLWAPQYIASNAT